MDWFTIYIWVMLCLCVGTLLFAKPIRRAIHGPDDFLSRDTDADGIEALAEAMAAIDGKDVSFRLCKSSPEYDNLYGHYEVYTTEAKELLESLEKRGFTITPL